LGLLHAVLKEIIHSRSTEHHGGTVTKSAQRLRAQARLQLIFTVIFSILTIAAVVFPVWIEEVSGLSPDGESGEAEMLLAIPFGLASIVLGVMTFRSRRRAAATASQQSG
jgi:hypothetical protein